MNVYSQIKKAGLRVRYAPVEFNLPTGDRGFYLELQNFNFQKCSKKRCRKYGRECEWR